MAVEYIVYGADHSYYTGKVRAYMRYKGLNWEERTATREIYKSIILPKIGAPIVPVLETADGEYIQDTTDIIDFLESRHPAGGVYPAGPVQRLIALLFELYGDEWLIIPAMHYRWSVIDQQREFIFKEFGRMSNPNGSEEEQIAIGEKTSKGFSRMLPALGISEATIPAIEAVYLEFLDQLDRHFEQHNFLLGSRPSIGDFGFIGPLYAHLARDPVPKAIMQERAPNVFAWVERMNNPNPLSGEFLADDEVPETLLPILKTQMKDQLPDVLDAVAKNAAWLEANPGGNIPRFLGMHSFTTGDASGERVISSFAQWMYQRAYIHYQSLQGQDREAADQFLKAVGGYESLSTPMPKRLERKAGQLELVEADS
jgi:glutathione S-transferase